VGLADVGHEENDGEDDAERANDDVADREEVVLPAKHVCSREHKVFLTLELTHVVGVSDGDLVFAGWEAAVDLAPELAEVRETGSPHPNNEMLILDVLPLDILPISVAGSHVFVDAVELLVFEFVLDVGLPGNICLVDGDRAGGGSVCAFDSIGVGEKTLGDEAARNGNIGGDKCLALDVGGDARTCQVLVEDDGLAGGLDLALGPGLSHELLVITRFHIPSMVLIEVVELVVHENFVLLASKGLFKLEWHYAVCAGNAISHLLGFHKIGDSGIFLLSDRLVRWATVISSIILDLQFLNIVG